MKFKLQATHDDGTTISHEFESPVWYLALDSFVKFLRGCGYHLEDNSVGINGTLGHYGLEDHALSNIAVFDGE